MSFAYKKAADAHNMARFLDVPFDDAWQAVTCLRKKGYDDYDSAEKVASSWGQRVYRCPVCGRYHLATVSSDAAV